MSRQADTVSPESSLLDGSLPTREGDRSIRVLAGSLLTLSAGFFVVVTVIAHVSPGYFDRLLLSAFERREPPVDNIVTGSTTKADPEEATSAGTIVPIPVPQTERAKPLTPRDFHIVMVFGNEAQLASPGELWRVKVGSLVPGLGQILAIQPNADGGIVEAENAVLKGVPVTR